MKTTTLLPRRQFLKAAAAFSAALAAHAGCQKVERRPGLTWRGHEYEQFVHATPDQVAGAVRESLADLGLMCVETLELGGGKYRYSYRNQQDTRAIVRIEPAPGETVATRYTVEVYPGGSEGRSVQLIQRINSKIGVGRMRPQPPASARGDEGGRLLPSEANAQAAR